MVFWSWAIVHRRERYRRTHRRLDRLRTAECPRQDRRARTRRGHEPLGDQHRHLLRRLAPRRVEFHHDAPEHAHERHVVDAHAAHLLGVVYNGGAGPFVVPGSARRWDPAAARPHRGNQLLHPEWPLRQRTAFRFKPEFPAAHRWFSNPLATPVLVLRTSGGLHRDSSGHGATSHILATFARKPVFGYRAM